MIDAMLWEIPASITVVLPRHLSGIFLKPLRAWDYPNNPSEATPLYSPAVIPAGTYAGQTEDVQTFYLDWYYKQNGRFRRTAPEDQKYFRQFLTEKSDAPD